jgi:hypothetical protein
MKLNDSYFSLQQLTHNTLENGRNAWGALYDTIT